MDLDIAGQSCAADFAHVACPSGFTGIFILYGNFYVTCVLTSEGELDITSKNYSDTLHPLLNKQPRSRLFLTVYVSLDVNKRFRYVLFVC